MYFSTEKVECRCDLCGKNTVQSKHCHMTAPGSFLFIHAKRFGVDGEKLNVSMDIEEQVTVEGNKYCLRGYVSHLGLDGAGHYISNLRLKDGEDKLWGTYDDNTVSKFYVSIFFCCFFQF